MIKNPRNSKKKILILGAGFAGLRVALNLAKEKNKIPNHDIVLVDKRDVHMYTPDLYEIATAYSNEINEECLTELSETVAMKISRLAKGKPITFIHDKVVGLDPKKQTATFQNKGALTYDRLIIALGSVSNYYDIPGLEQFSYPLKTVKHALAIHCDLDHYFQYLWKKKIKREVHLIVGGGGATGVEFAGELPECVTKICKKYKYPRARVHITLIQALDELIGVGPEFSKKIQNRLKAAGVDVQLNTYITEAKAGSITVKAKSGKGQKHIKKNPCDMLIWAGGVKPHPLLQRLGLPTTPRGSIEVNEYLESTQFPHVFAAGDIAGFIDPMTKKPAPWLAQVAIAQGHILSDNILASLYKKPLRPYRTRIKGVIIPVCGKYAVYKGPHDKQIHAGFIFWIARRLIDLYYALTIMPWPRAVRKWFHATGIFTQND